MTQFTVILPTRNRPEMFRCALDSVLMQRDADFELIVIHDGSDCQFMPAYQKLFDEYEGRFRLVELKRHKRGHGHAHGVNTGAALAKGEYLAFLDDDDWWTDDLHLNRASRAIAQEGGMQEGQVDMYLSNQAAWSQGKQLPPPVWIGDVLEKVPNLPGPDAVGCYRVTASDMVQAWGFCHLNTLIIRREFFDRIGGVDEYLRYECDRDFYFRALDRAGRVLYHPKFIARHNVPLVGKQANVSTQVSSTEKLLYQLLILGRLHLSVHTPALRSYAWRYRAYTLQHLAALYAGEKLYRTALPYAIEGFSVRPSPHWLMQTCRIALLALAHGDRKGPKLGAVQPKNIGA
jgi:glycosyltransferase involved in cell wall biosynthesis